MRIVVRIDTYLDPGLVLPLVLVIIVLNPMLLMVSSELNQKPGLNALKDIMKMTMPLIVLVLKECLKVFVRTPSVEMEFRLPSLAASALGPL